MRKWVSTLGMTLLTDCAGRSRTFSRGAKSTPRNSARARCREVGLGGPSGRMCLRGKVIAVFSIQYSVFSVQLEAPASNLSRNVARCHDQHTTDYWILNTE